MPAYLPWLHQPAAGVLERLEWMTDVLAAYDQSEQRRALRGRPRRSFEFDVILEGGARSIAETMIRAGQALPWAVPVWSDAQPLPSAVSSGVSDLPCTTAGRDYAVDGYVAIFTDAQNFHIAQIDGVDPDAVSIDTPTARAWPAGVAMIAPVRMCAAPESAALARFTGAAAYGRHRWEVIGPSGYEAADESAGLYRGLPILAQAPNWTEDIGHEIRRAREIVDAMTGPVYREAQAAGPISIQSHSWLLDGFAQITAFRSWLYARRGRLSGFWLPSFALDLVLAANAGAGDDTIDVQTCGAEYLGGIGRRDILIVTAAGQRIARRIESAAVLTGSVDRLQLDSAIGQSLTPAGVHSIQFMAPARLDADAIEIQYSGQDLAESRAMTVSTRDDL